MPVGAAAPTSQPKQAEGLLVTPVRQEVKVDAGKTREESIVVANMTDTAITVTLSVKSFTVTNYTYDYRFSNPEDEWISLSQNQTTLASRQSKTIPFTVRPHAKATPGGYYYTVVVSTQNTGSGVPSTIQAASLLYITVNGRLVQTGHIEDFSAPRVVFGKEFDVSIDALNTGNVYYFASITGRVKGLFTEKANIAPNHLLIPNKVRRVSNVIKSPLLPGFYPIDVQYTTDTGTKVSASQWVLFLPFWFTAALIGCLLLWNVIRARRKHDSSVKSDEP